VINALGKDLMDEIKNKAIVILTELLNSSRASWKMRSPGWTTTLNRLPRKE